MAPDPPRLHFGLLGFGELAVALAGALRASGVTRISAWSRQPNDVGQRLALQRRISAAGVTQSQTLVELVSTADAVMSCLPADAVAPIAEQAARALRSGTLYVDFATASPAVKESAAAVIGGVGGRYVDAAVLGAVAAGGVTVPIVAAGPAAAEFAVLSRDLGLVVSAIHAPAGGAAKIKLLRSAYLKGRDALVAEMMLAAHRLGVGDSVVRSIGGPGEEVPFPDLVDRILRSLALHAHRRAAELHAAEDLLQQAGVEPAAVRGGVRRLQLLAGLHLREEFGGQRPASGEEVLSALDRLGAG